jgi:pSer/pThr/pTyr-binding forkhead associated (FHA) protein
MDDNFEDQTIRADDLPKKTGSESGQATLPKARLVCLDDSLLADDQKGLVIDLTDKEMLLGRVAEGNDIVLKSKKISRQHARIFPEKDLWNIEDLKSTNGVMINNQEIMSSVMRSGDTVAIGTIPFRFEVEELELPAEEPEVEPVEEEEEEETDKTMLFGDLGASQAILEADEAEEEAPPIPEPTKEKTSPAFRAAVQTEPVKKDLGALKGILKAFVFIAIIAVLGGGGFYYYTNIYKVEKEKENLIRQYKKEISRFTEDFENHTVQFDRKSHEDSLFELNALMKKIETGVAKFPGITEFEALDLTLFFMKLEREVRFSIEKDDPEKALSLITEARNKAAKYESKSRTEKSEAAKRIQEVAELVDLMEIVAKYKIFELNYPDPDQAEKVEDVSAVKNEILKLNRLKDRFGELKKKNNKPLRVVFRYFGGMVSEVDERGLTLVDRWDRWLWEKS